MTHIDCPVPINNLSVSKIDDFGQGQPQKKKKKKKQTDKTFFGKC